ALSAIDHLSDSDSASAQETPVPVIKKPEPKVSAPVTKKPEREASTTVMKMSPELLAAMKKKGKAKKAVATTEAASGSATADLFGQAGFQKTTPPSEESPPQLSERDDVATRVGTAPEMATTVRRVPAEIMEKARGEKLQAEAKAKAALKNEAKELESFVDVEPEDDDPRGLFRPVFDDFVRT
ncbi:hypothetical protein KAI87_15820, partial [Myxococcota bacterium]|nr:hypothetical protein [Myxococcota bacterium]